MTYGHSRQVWLYNLKDETVINKRPLSNDHVLSKHFHDQSENVHIINEQVGGYFYERYHIPSMQLKKFSLKPPRIRLEKFKQYNFNTPNLIIEYA